MEALSERDVDRATAVVASAAATGSPHLPSLTKRELDVLALVTATVVASAASVFAFGAKAEPPWGPATPPFNLEVILRDVTGGQGFGHVKFRQPNDGDKIVFLGTWVRDLAPNHSYMLQRAVDT